MQSTRTGVTTTKLESERRARRSTRGVDMVRRRADTLRRGCTLEVVVRDRTR
jgi:hypothetical protein